MHTNFVTIDYKVAIHGLPSELYIKGQHMIAATSDSDIVSKGEECDWRRDFAIGRSLM